MAYNEKAKIKEQEKKKKKAKEAISLAERINFGGKFRKQ